MRRHKAYRSAMDWRPRLRLVGFLGLSLLFVTGVSLPEASAAKKETTKKDASKAHPDPREIQAREAFAAGRFREALELYAKLYAENLHPTYLRNIGRCHQNMGSADEAIVSFRDYLRKAPLVTASEREEVEGFIKEMEALKEKQARAAQDKPESPPVPPPVAPPPVQPAGVNLEAKAQPEPEPEPSDPFYKRSWFWIATGAVVAAGVVGGLWAGGVFSSSSGCRAGYDCQPNP